MLPKSIHHFSTTGRDIPMGGGGGKGRGRYKGDDSAVKCAAVLFAAFISSFRSRIGLWGDIMTTTKGRKGTERIFVRRYIFCVSHLRR